MGVSTDAILFYGKPLGAVDEHGYGDDGYERPWVRWSPGMDVDDEDDDGWETENRLSKQYNCEIVRYCSGDDPMYAVAVKDSIQRVSRGQIKPIHTPSHHPYTWDENLQNFMRALGVPDEERRDTTTGRRVSWYLVSYMG